MDKSAWEHISTKAIKKLKWIVTKNFVFRIITLHYSE